MVPATSPDSTPSVPQTGSGGAAERDAHPAPAHLPHQPGPAAVTKTPGPKKPKAGRDLKAAIAAGVFLGALILVSLLIRKELFVVLATVASVLGTRELLTVMPSGKFRPSWVPTLIAAAVIPVTAYVWGPTAMLAALVGSVITFLVWGALANKDVADTAASSLIALYVPALVAFAMMLLGTQDGVARIVTFVLVTVSSDIGGYVAGVLFGRHPMAPTVSPKKSWEGFAGSFASCVAVGMLTVSLVLGGPLWVGVLLGALVVVAATVGDLCESMIKRDLGIKDMSNLIPGHGGLMDRLDSLVLAAPVSWAVLSAFVSP